MVVVFLGVNENGSWRSMVAGEQKSKLISCTGRKQEGAHGDLCVQERHFRRSTLQVFFTEVNLMF